MSFRDALRSGFVFLDGSMGTALQSFRSPETGPSWKVPEELNLTNPDLITRVHTEYLDAGSTVILTNTFGANRLKLAEEGYDAREVIEAACAIARKAVSAYKGRFVALDVGPTGRLLEPMGDCSFDEAYEAFAEAAIAGEAAGADLIVIETMSDLYELKAAVLACKEHTALPIVASATFQENNRTLTGADPLTVVTLLEGLGVDALGFNCGHDLAHARELVDQFVAHASVPVLMEPNAGIPVIEAGKTVFKVGPADFAEALAYGASRGARLLGGCCGTRSGHIKAMVDRVSGMTPVPVRVNEQTRVSSWGATVVIGNDPIVVGERINPTGKKRFREAILAGDMNYILSEAGSQVSAGSHVLDVNVGIPGIDEAAVMVEAMRAIQRTYPIPLQIDSSESDVLERALRYYNGVPLVNSVNGKKKVMDSVFPIVKRYGGVVVALALDEEGIPPTARGRLAVAKRIVETAESYGIPRKNVIIDTLTLTVSSQQKEAMETVKALALVRDELGLKTILGVSNISFGLPQRDVVNANFLMAALANGLSCCIVNPLSGPMMAAYRSYRALAGFDDNCLEYIERYARGDATGGQAPSAGLTPAGGQASPAGQADAALARPIHGSTSASSERVADDDLKSIIATGLKAKARRAAELLLETKRPVEIIDGYIVPALDEVGRDYESGRKFLPQLLMSADTVSQAFEAIKERLAAAGESGKPKGSILLATVHGDIHDIGKNIVKAMLGNYGYGVIDLGKDVSPEAVVERALRDRPGIVGLSALMTTTVSSMEATIKSLRAAGYEGSIMVGGAVLTPEYASRIGADHYAKDAMGSVAIARKHFG